MAVELPTHPQSQIARQAGLRLVVIGDGLFEEHTLPDGGAVVLGRGEEADIRVEHVSVSRRHAQLDLSPVLQISDLGSANGTMVRGAALAANTPTRMVMGEAVQIGSVLVMVREPVSPPRPRRVWPHGYFEGRIEEECARASRSGSSFAVLRIAVARVGATPALQQAISAALRAEDVLGVYGPDEYEALLAGVDATEAARYIDRLQAALKPLTAGARIGASYFPADGITADELVQKAGQASSARPEEPFRSPPTIESRPHQNDLLVRQIAASNLSVLILGETGAGKEVMAEMIHRYSNRAEKPLLRLHCAALTESLLESELFGHEKGAFTGAVRAKPGLLETADGGTVFLDEVGELPLSIQVKLLRVLEDRKVMRVGSVVSNEIDVRFIAATNRKLEAEIARGTFRADLYFRLNGTTLSVPSLRERRNQIVPLARQFIASTSLQLGHSRTPELSPEVGPLLERYAWPGNIRELRNMIERAVVLCGGGDIRRVHLPVEKMEATIALPSGSDGEETPAPLTPSESLGDGADMQDDGRAFLFRARVRAAERERERILEALAQSHGNQTAAARLLGMSRRTLLRRLDLHGIYRPRKHR